MRSSPLLHVTLELDHALRSLLVLADRRSASTAMTAGELAQATDVPAHFLSRVLQKLQRSGLVRRAGGPRGMQLARPATAITLAEVVAAIQGRWDGAPAGPGPVREDALGPLWRDVERSLETQLSRLTIADLLARSPELASASVTGAERRHADDYVEVSGPGSFVSQ